jgi:hypothetical protein
MPWRRRIAQADLPVLVVQMQAAKKDKIRLLERMSASVRNSAKRRMG